MKKEAIHFCYIQLPISEDIKNLRSAQKGHPVQLKFSNRTHSYATLELVDQNGHPKHLKDIAPKKAWSFNTFEGQYFIAYEKGKKHDKLALNYGQFWKATKPHIPNFVEKVLITEGKATISCVNYCLQNSFTTEF